MSDENGLAQLASSYGSERSLAAVFVAVRMRN